MPSPRPEGDGANLRRWLPAAAAAAVVAVVVGIGLSGRGDRSDAASDAGSTAATSTLVGDPASASTTAPVVTETQPTVPKTHLTATVGTGSSGAEVTTVQQRL